MKILITNDDGPPDDSVSPYIANFVRALQAQTNWEIVIALPNRQRSWIGKAHIIGENIQGTVIKNELTGDLGWLLLSGTPASCASIGVKHLGPFDLVISGPNYGRNTSAAYIMSSGTVGAAVEAAISGVRSIALSFSYTVEKHPQKDIDQASQISVGLVKYLFDNWNPEVQVYSINVPLYPELSSKTPIRYTKVLENLWTDVFSRPDPEKHEYVWEPNYSTCDETVYSAGPGSDAWTVMHNEVTVSPLRAIFHSVNISDEINLKGYI